MRSTLRLSCLLLAASCAQAPVVQQTAALVEPDLGPLPLSLQPHFACGPDKLRRSESEEAMKRAEKSLREAENTQGVDPATLKRLEDDRAVAQKNRDEAHQAYEECGERTKTLARTRFDTAATRPAGEIRAIPEDERLDAEKQRMKSEDDKLRATLRDEPAKLMVPIVSALLCATVSGRQAVADELTALQAAPKKQAKQNAPKVAEAKTRHQRAEALVVGLEQELAKTGGQQLPCETPEVTAFADCLMGRGSGARLPACEDPRIGDLLAAWDAFGVGERLKDSWAPAF
ncbi:MAG: hypothetical protein QM765_02880 [Myxococcales bacterium]